MSSRFPSPGGCNVDRLVRRAWEDFMAGRGRPGGVRDAVADSWRRSQQNRVTADRHAAPVASEAEVHRRRSGSLAFMTAARPVLSRARLLLADAGAMMILTDAGGVILETEGDARMVERGRGSHLETGGRWAEADIGTNAIGAALAAVEPVRIHGAEHFCEGVQVWSCAAAPVRHPLGGDLLGVVDISGPADSFNPQSLALAVSIGGEIAASLAEAGRAEHATLLEHLALRRARLAGDDLVVFDRRGLIVHAGPEARRRLAGEAPDLLGENRLTFTRMAGPAEWEERLLARLPRAGLEIVNGREAEGIGAILILPPLKGGAARRPPVPVAPPAPEPGSGLDRILGDSAVMRATRERARLLAESDVAVLIEGETGVGKEEFARALHAASPARSGPFVPVNCGGMARELVASELFGYARGSFTGADDKGRTGRIVAADGGVLCLDEIGEMPLDLQPFLLRVLEDRVVYPIGGSEGQRVDVRLVSMTNRSLADEVADGRFRRDLYYRVAAARLPIPPLRDRGEDILLLARHFLAISATRLRRPVPDLTADAIDLLMAHGWPGNVRELRNVMDTLVTLAPGGRITPEDLPPDIRDGPPAGAPSGLPKDLRGTEKAAILACLEACGGNLAETARRLGIARSTLYVRLAEYGLARRPRG